jgi:hypothetical protein
MEIVDLQGHTVVAGAAVQIGPTALTTTTSYTVSGTVMATGTMTQLATYNFTFPQVLATLTAAQRDQLMGMIFRYLIACETGY